MNKSCKTMSLAGKMVSEIEINSPAQKYYKVFKDEVSHMPNISPNIIQTVQVHGGGWDTHGHGSIRIWNFTVDGKAEVYKEQVGFDDEKFATTLNGLEGDMFEHYKSFKATYQVVPKGPDHSLAIHTIEYEKLNEGSPFPHKYLGVMTNLTKDIETHLK